MQCTTRSDVTADDAQAIELARLTLYRFLSLALTDPEAQRWDALACNTFLDAAVAAAEVMRCTDASRAEALAPGELAADWWNLRVIVAQLRNPFFEADLEYQRTFGLLVSKKAPPYETEYCRQTLTIYRQQVLADIAGFYRAFGLEPSRELPERHDHLALELEFMAWLISKEQRARQTGTAEQADVCREAQRAFLRDHLVWWTPAFATLLRLSCEGPQPTPSADAEPRTFYGAVAAALCAFIYFERTRFALPASAELLEPRPSDPPDEVQDRSTADGSVSIGPCHTERRTAGCDA